MAFYKIIYMDVINMFLLYHGKIFKSYDKTYYVSNSGDIYSMYKRGILKHYIDKYGYHRVDIHGKHIKVHKLVYLTWNGDIPENKQINHLDDNKDNNYYKNLYLGTQKENIDDCKRNNHRLGNIKCLTLLDKDINKIIVFPSVKKFIEYSGHSNVNGSFSKVINKKWFKKKFKVIEIKSVETIESYNDINNNYIIKK